MALGSRVAPDRSFPGDNPVMSFKRGWRFSTPPSRRKDTGQPLGIVRLIDVFDVCTALLCRFGITDVVDIKAERLRQIVKSVKFELLVDRL